MNEGYAIFIDDNEIGTKTKLSWEELKLDENGKKYGYDNTGILETLIKQRVFSQCEKLEEISITENIGYIYESAFAYCYNLEKVTFPSTLTRIQRRAFEFCPKIKEIKLPENILLVEKEAFRNCHQLERIIAPRGLYIPDEFDNKVLVEPTEKKLFNYDFYLNILKDHVDIPTEKELRNVQYAAERLLEIEREFENNKAYYAIYVKEGIEEILNIKNAKGERYFDVFDLTDFYKRKTKMHYTYDEDCFLSADYNRLNEVAKEYIKYSRYIGIRPDLESDLNALRKEYIRGLECEVKYLKKQIMPVQDNSIEKK